MLRPLSVFMLFILSAYLVVRSEAKCFKHRTRNKNCCCKRERELGSTTIPSSSTLQPSSSLPSSTSTLLKTRTNSCVCECNPPTNVSNGIPLIGVVDDENQLGHCSCSDSKYYATAFFWASKTSSVSLFHVDPPISIFSEDCSDLCLRSQDDILYVPQNGFYRMNIPYYCGPNNDPNECAFYAVFYPDLPDAGDPPVILVSEDGKHVFQNGNNTEPLGPTSGYLKIVRASCAGCSILTAAECNSKGTLKINPRYNYIFDPKLTLL